jgi:hypothetical protein
MLKSLREKTVDFLQQRTADALLRLGATTPR